MFGCSNWHEFNYKLHSKIIKNYQNHPIQGNLIIKPLTGLALTKGDAELSNRVDPLAHAGQIQHPLRHMR